MGEGNHTTATSSLRTPRQKLVLILAGTSVALLAAGVLFQIFQAEPGQAEVERTAEQAGAARVSSTSDQPVARVGKQVIGYDEVARECFDRYGKDVLDQIINRKIIEQACTEKGMVVTEVEVKKEINDIAARFKLPTDQWYKMLQAERNLTPLQYQRDIIWPMLALKKLAGTDVQVTKTDLEQAFQRDFGRKVKAKMIMLDNFRRANDVWEQAVKKPSEFERLVQQFSIEPNSKALGGDIPPIRQHGGNESLEKAAFKLRKGDISPIIQVGPQVQPRFVILLCEGYTEPVATKMEEEIYNELYTQLKEEKIQEGVANIFDELKNNARIDNYLTGTTSGGLQQVSGTQPGGYPKNPVAPAAGSAAPRTAPPNTAAPRTAAGQTPATRR